LLLPFRREELISFLAFKSPLVFTFLFKKKTKNNLIICYFLFFFLFNGIPRHIFILFRFHHHPLNERKERKQVSPRDFIYGNSKNSLSLEIIYFVNKKGKFVIGKNWLRVGNSVDLLNSANVRTFAGHVLY
jgi:hypothetical protein